MKVLFIHTNYIQRGGEDVVYENEVRLSEEAGWETRSLLFNNKKYAALKFFFFFFNPVSFWQTRQMIRKFRPDVVHIHNWFFAASPAVFIAARWMKVPVVHTIHNFRILCPSGFIYERSRLSADCMSKAFPFQAIRNKVYRNSAADTAWLLAGTRLHYFLRTWQRIDLMICLTGAAREMLCKSLLKIDPARVVVKPNFFAGSGLDIVLNGQLRQDFMFVGRLSVEKGVGMLLDAFRNSPFKLYIIGDGPLRGEVEACVADNPNVHYLGYRDKAQIIKLLSKSAALIFPTMSFEQFGNVIIEAFFSGTPVIGPDSSSPAELIVEGYNGFHFKTGSVSDLRQKIQYYQSLPESTRHCLSQNAISSYRKYYTPETNLVLLSNIYKSVLHENNADL